MTRISNTIVAGLASLAMAAAVVLPDDSRVGRRMESGWRRLARRRLAWRRLAWRWLAWRRLAWRRLARRLGWRPVVAPRLLARRRLVRRLVGSRNRRRSAGRRGYRHLPLLGRGLWLWWRLWLWRRLLAGSADLRRLWQLSRPAVRERLLAISRPRDQSGRRATARAGQNAPPVIGFGTPVVAGKEIGRPRRDRKAR